MNFTAAVLWMWVLSVVLSICNAQLSYNVTMFTSSTFDVTIRCDLSAFVNTHPYLMAGNIQSLQILQHHAPHSKERMLAELNLARKTYTPSSFLNSSVRFFAVEAAENLAENGLVWLSLSLSSVHAIPDNQLSYQCGVVFSQAALNGTRAGSKLQQWRSQRIFFLPRSTEEQRPGIHVRVSEGVTVTCLVRKSSEGEGTDSSRNEVSVELLRQDDTKRSHLCTGDSLGSSRVKCQRDVFETGTLFRRDRAHLFKPTCEDFRMYFCTVTTPSVSLSSMVEIPSSDCSEFSSAELAARIGFCFLIFVIGCVLIVFVIYAIFLIFIPSSRPGGAPPPRLLPKRGGSYHIASSTEKDMEKYLGY